MPRLYGLLAAAVLLVGCSAGAMSPAPAASPSPSPAVSAAPSAAAASLAPVPSPTPAPTASMPPAPELEPGWDVYVMDAGGDLRVRSKPSTDADSLKYEPLLAVGSRMTILEGPLAGSGLWWYRVHLEEGLALDGGRTEGWVAAGSRDGTPWINVGGLDCDPGEWPSLAPGESPPDVVC